MRWWAWSTRVGSGATSAPGRETPSVLTKPLGTGIISTAIKQAKAPERAVTPPSAAWRPSTGRRQRRLPRYQSTRVTDVTGFGLLGHLQEMSQGSKVRVRLQAGRIPLLPDVVALAEAGLIPGGTRRNLHAVAGTVRWDASITEVRRFVIGDAQTSGGLLVATPDGAALLKALGAAVVEGAARRRVPGGSRGSSRWRHDRTHAGRPGRRHHGRGGASREIALLMGKHGARGHERTGRSATRGGAASPAEDVAREIKEAGGQAVPSGESVTTMAGGARIVETAVDHFGRIDIVVNNAGIVRDRMIFNMTEEEWDAVIAVHLKGSFALTRAAAPRFREQRWGRFINMTSPRARRQRGPRTTPRGSGSWDQPRDRPRHDAVQRDRNCISPFAWRA
jgi:hypothetical protein